MPRELRLMATQTLGKWLKPSKLIANCWTRLWRGGQMCRMIYEMRPAFRALGPFLPSFSGDLARPKKLAAWKHSEQTSGAIGMESLQMPRSCSVNR
jgi:hypothetical protein